MPLRRSRYLAVIPLVIGSMTPDVFLFFIPPAWTKALPQSHSLLGTLTEDLLAGYALLAALLLLKLPLTAPLWEPHRSFLRAEISKYFALPRCWLIALPSLLIGSWTHVLWDSFTHRDRWVVRHVTWLQYPLLPNSSHPLDVYRLLQYVCSVFGLTLIAFWYVRSLRGSGLRGTGRKWRKYLLASLVGVAVLIGAAVAVKSRNFASFYRLATVTAATAMNVFFSLYLITGLAVASAANVHTPVADRSQRRDH